jgi:hypothetical protein
MIFGKKNVLEKFQQEFITASLFIIKATLNPFSATFRVM